MNTIFLINETFLALPNQSLSMEYQQLSCICKMDLWLFIHFIISYITVHVCLCYVIGLCLMLLLFRPDYGNHITDFIGSMWMDTYHLDRYSSLIIVMKRELKLISVYLYVVFCYMWLELINSNYRVTYFNFLRWLIEASIIPVALICVLMKFSLSLLEFCTVYHEIYVPLVIVKIPMFILLRYAEIQPDCSLNRLQVLLFETYCYRFRQ